MNQETSENRIQALLALRQKPSDLVRELKAVDSDTLYVLISQTGSTGSTGAEYEAVRETAIAILQERQTDSLVTTMKRLDRSATILSRIGIVVAAVIGIAQILLPLLVKH